MPGRPERIGDQIRAEVSTLLLRSVRDPALRLITLTHVKVSRDLRHARVYYTAPIDASAIETKRGLRRAAPFLRGQLGRRVRLRHVPELTFVYDDSFEREQRIAQVLEEIHLSAPAAQDNDDDGNSTD
ncbi:MAG: 30S ribosome-binding factor RbfA [Vicinamibacterales bacterium]|jgi:ribosome-binding factor A|nr:30S ribosome-binding factor RbfA [Vicinamibacterales bacterium]